jgi:cell wall-associated NlpC family hydrolase
LRLTHGLRAITLATLVALAGTSALTAPVAATDPIPTPAPTASPDPAATPAPTATPDPAATPAPSPTAPAPVALAPVAKPHLGARVVRIALSERHKRYVYGASGPSAFDCSGFVRYAYRRAGVSGHLGGGHSAYAMYRWARAHHRTSRSHPRVGDVVVYGGGTHVGIYIGHGRVISALNPRLGIRITSLYALTARFTTFIHTGI